MRITVALDPDLAEQVRQVAARRGIPFKAALNAAIRAGLAAEQRGSQPYRVPARPMGLRPAADLTHALRIADALEDEETVGKLAPRK